MNEKYIERPKKFDKKSYDRQYQKDHYQRFVADLKPELKTRIDNYCSDVGISKSEFLQRAIELLEKSD